MSTAASLQDLPVDPVTPDGRVEVDLSHGGLLGFGAHGVVRAGKVKETGELVAVKVSPTARSLKCSVKELTVLTVLGQHPHVVRVHSAQVNVSTGLLYLVLELCEGGELFDKIAESGGFQEREGRHFFAQIASAIAHCHAARVFHRDLKPENILLDGQDVVKVADFGLASLRSVEAGGHLKHTRCGSVSYAAPEVHTAAAEADDEGSPHARDEAGEGARAGYDPEKADVWSLGVVLYCMMTARLPFEVAHPDVCLRYATVAQKGIRVMCPESFSEPLVDLLGRLLSPDPAKRPRAAEIIAHPWLAGAQTLAPAAAQPMAAGHKWSELRTYVDGPGGTRQLRLHAAPDAAPPKAPPKALAAADPAQAPAEAMRTPDGERERAKIGLGPHMAPNDTWELLSEVPLPGPGSRRGGGSFDSGEAGTSTSPSTSAEALEPPRKKGRPHAPGAGDDGAAAGKAAAGQQDGVDIASLVRHLGWERLDGSAVDLMSTVIGSLEALGVEYVIDRQSKSLAVKGQAPTGAVLGSEGSDGSEGDGSEGAATRAAEVTIQLVDRCVAGAGETQADLHFKRRSGCTIAFHSLYRAFRTSMAATNGWEESAGVYSR